MSNYGICCLHHCTDRRQRQVDRSRVTTPTEKTQNQVHLISGTSEGRHAAVFSHRRKSNQESREGIFLANRAVRGENEALSRLCQSENAAGLALEEQRDHPLAEATSKVSKQQCTADFDCSIRELQRQIHPSRKEVDHTNLGYETSRREHARLHEESAQRERALRETHSRSIHEVEELKRD